MKITRSEVEKLLATMYRLEATEVELEFSLNYHGSYHGITSVDAVDFDIWECEEYITTALTIEEEKR